MNSRNVLRVALAALPFVLSAASCSSDDDSGLTVAESCQRYCTKADSLDCPANPTNMQVGCETLCTRSVPEMAWCLDEFAEHVECDATLDMADYLCDEDGRATTAEGTCLGEEQAFRECLAASVPTWDEVCAGRVDAFLALQCPADVAATRAGRIDECLALFAQYPDCRGDLVMAYSCPASLQPANLRCGADGAAALVPGTCPITVEYLSQCLAGAG